MDSKPIKFFIIAGEPSGDLHGGKLIQAIQATEPNSSFMGHGGPQMKEAGMQILEHTDDLAIMGFSEVVKHLPYMMKVMGKTVDTIARTKPDRVILIDYPGFNLRLAKRIQHLDIPITYFILPQVWAWKEKRVELMKSVLDQALSIIPFEQPWFESKGLPTNYVGHPFAEQTHLDEDSKSFYQRHDITIEHPLLTLLPGSRQQEINKHWPIFLEAVKILKSQLPKLQVMVGQAPNVELSPLPTDFKIETNSKKAIVAATAAIASSGTVTLECAAEDTPLVVCYKLSPVSWFLAKTMTNVTYASLVNLIIDQPLVPELLQENMTPNQLAEAVKPLLDSKHPTRKTMLAGFDQVRRTLGIPGVYQRAAEAIVNRTQNRRSD